MTVTFSHRTLQTRLLRLPDGRRITIRHAVPSDAPRLAMLAPREPSLRDVVAIDDHGAIVGYARSGAVTDVAEEWSASGLAALLERELARGE